MGVNRMLARCAARRVHVLIAEVPGNWSLRVQVERRIAARRWRQADSPADADVLVVCGSPGPELADVIDRIWDQLPGPRVRVAVDDPRTVDTVLAHAVEELVDGAPHRRDGRERAQSPEANGQRGGAASSENHEDHRHTDHDHTHHGDHHRMHHEGHAGHGGHMNHGGHHHMGHGDMQMAPLGIALAEGGEDRDGLEMDVLHLRLGPVLRHWPAGLVLRCALQGDVLTGSQAWMVDEGHRHHERAAVPSEKRAALRASQRCDHIADVLALAGWPRAVDVAREVRDTLLDAPHVGHAQPAVAKLVGALRRSRLLRWSLRGLTPLTAEDLRRHQLPAALAGDTYDRLLAQAQELAGLVSDPLADKQSGVDWTTRIGALPDLLDGAELATARLAVASFGIDTAPADAGRDG